MRNKIFRLKKKKKIKKILIIYFKYLHVVAQHMAQHMTQYVAQHVTQYVAQQWFLLYS